MKAQSTRKISADWRKKQRKRKRKRVRRRQVQRLEKTRKKTKMGSWRDKGSPKV